MSHIDHVQHEEFDTGQTPLSGKTCLVTGASSGLGKETALGLARAGAMVLLVCRDRGRGEAAAAEIRRRAPVGEVELLVGDLASQRQVRAARSTSRCQTCRSPEQQIDSRAQWPVRRSESVDGADANPHRDAEALREGLGRHPHALPRGGVLGRPCRVLGGARTGFVHLGRA